MFITTSIQYEIRILRRLMYSVTRNKIDHLIGISFRKKHEYLSDKY